MTYITMYILLVLLLTVQRITDTIHFSRFLDHSLITIIICDDYEATYSQSNMF